MRTTSALGALVGLTAAQVHPNKYTATDAGSVHAAQATAVTTHPTSNVAGAVFNRYVVIYCENTDYSMAAGDPNFQWLATQGLTLSNYTGVTHPSQPNYVASIGGDNFGMDNDAFNQIDANVSSIIDLLDDKGISWGSYQEDMPYSGYEGANWQNQQNGRNDYERKHHPEVIFNANTTPKRLSQMNNLTMFYQELQSQTLPQYLTITPNMTNDGHDTSVTVAGQFVRNFITPLMSNSYFWNNTLVLVTFDESQQYTTVNRVFSVALGGALPKSLVGTTDPNYYNHYSDIATVEANWNLHTLGRWDVGANVFQFVGQKTGDTIRSNTAVTSRNPTRYQKSSYAGPFNSDRFVQYPAPNTTLFTHGTGRTVLPSIVSLWKGYKCTYCDYYTDTVVIPDGDFPPPGYSTGNCNSLPIGTLPPVCLS